MLSSLAANLGLGGEDLERLAVSPICVALFALVCAAFAYADITGRPGWLARQRVQADVPRPTAAEYAALFPVAVWQNGAIAVFLLPPLTLLAYRAADLQPLAAPLPSPLELLWELAAMALLYDLWFWAVHRLMHLPALYRRFHKLHHTWKSPCALEGAYFTAADFVVGNYAPMLFLPLLVTRRLLSIQIFGCLGVVSVALTHSGYNFESILWFLGPLAPSTRHDAHHELFEVNFSTFAIFDVLTGTHLSGAAAAERRSRSHRSRAGGGRCSSGAADKVGSSTPAANGSPKDD